MLAAGGVVAAETALLNAHYGRSLGDNLLRNVGLASGAALVTTGIGMAITGGIVSGAVQGGLYRVGNAMVGLCSRHPVACSRVMVGLQVWDTLEDLGLQAKLALQTARGDPGAVDTALELQLERLDNVPGNATAQEVIGKVAGLFNKKRDEAAQIATSLARLGAGVDVGDDGLIHVSPGTAQDAIDDAVEELRRLTGRNVWASGNTIYINSPSLEAVEAAAKLEVAARTGADRATIERLIEP